MSIARDQFEFIRRFLAEQAGCELEPDQKDFTANRLMPIAAQHGWNHLEPLIVRLRDHHDRPLAQEVVEALVTHETQFFRDPHYFEELGERVLPRLIARRSSDRRLSVWCAACSTGQEAYSVAILLRERFAQQLSGWQVEIWATDLSSMALRQALSGTYSNLEVGRGLSEARLYQHFRRAESGWRIAEPLRQMVRFHRTNLTGVWPTLPALDLVLLRNVLVYMAPATRQAILARIESAMHPEGYLMLGSTESTLAPNLRVANVRVGPRPT